MAPKITVCMPVYNGAAYLATSIKSVLAQDAVDVELYVVDDCSPDDSQLRAEEIRDSRMRVIRNSNRLGLVGNWNRCLALTESGSNPILLFHQDDRMRPGFLAEAIAAMERHPKVGFVFSSAVSINELGHVQGGHWSQVALPPTDTYFTGDAMIHMLLTHGNVVPCQSVVVRAKAYKDSGGFNPELRYTPDLEMWLRLADRWDVFFLSDAYVEIRRHSDQESSHFLGSAREIDEVRYAFQSFLSNSRIADGLYPAAYVRLARSHLRQWSWRRLRQAIRRCHWLRALDVLGSIIRMRIAILLGDYC